MSKLSTTDFTAAGLSMRIQKETASFVLLPAPARLTACAFVIEAASRPAMARLRQLPLLSRPSVFTDSVTPALVPAPFTAVQLAVAVRASMLVLTATLVAATEKPSGGGAMPQLVTLPPLSTFTGGEKPATNKSALEPKPVFGGAFTKLTRPTVAATVGFIATVHSATSRWPLLVL